MHKLRPSDYNIYIPLLDSEDYILIHGYSGAIDIVKPDVVKFLKGFSEGNKRRRLITSETKSILTNRGYLTEKTHREEQDYKMKIGNLLLKQQKKHRKPGFLIIPTYDCNLKCPYCYQRGFRSKKGHTWAEACMDKKAVDLFYEAISKIQTDFESNGRRAIMLYGGEPLLQKNFEVVEYIIKKGLEKGYIFDAVTNGVELDRFSSLLGTDKIRRIQITIDGPPRVQDVRRPRSNGSGSFKDITRNVSMALESGTKVIIRINTDRNNIDYLEELADLFYQYGWIAKKNFSAYASQIHPGNLKYYELIKILMAKSEYNEKMKYFSSSLFLKRFKNIFNNKKMMNYIVASCNANKGGMYIFDPFGDIYPCWETAGDPTQRIGRYTPKLEIKKDFFKREWLGRSVLSIPECRECKYSFFCGGGCAYYAYKKSGSYLSPLCDNFKDFFTVSIQFLSKEVMHFGSIK